MGLACLTLAGGSLLAVAPAHAAVGLTTQDLSGVSPTATDLADLLAGAGVTVSNVTYTGASVAAGTFAGGSGIVGFESGVILSSGDVANVVGPNDVTGRTTQNFTAGDADLSALSGVVTNDAAVLEFDFVPDKSTVSFNYVFASDEYNEFANSEFNDTFGFFVNAANCAVLPSTSTPVSVNTINGGNPLGTDPQNAVYYVNNDFQDGSAPVNTQMDGLTVVLTCTATVTPNVTNHMKLAIADGTDHALDSNVLLQAGSLTTNVPPVLTVPAASSVQYSDAIVPQNVSATDADSDAITLGASGLPAALAFTDNGDGTGTATGTATAAPGPYPVTYSANDGQHGDVIGTSTITVAKEDCTLTSPVVILSSASSTTPLTAHLGEPDASPGDRSGKSIEFSLTSSGGGTFGPYVATTDSNGDATAHAALAADVYSMAASFGGDDYYLPCATTSETLVTVQAAAAKATGGGWMSNTVGRTSFGFNAIKDVTGLHGQLQVRTTSKSRFHGKVVLTLSGSGNNATWTGTGYWNGLPGYTYSVSVVDNGSSGSKKHDTISIVVKNASNSTVFTTSGAQPLKGGNITVH